MSGDVNDKKSFYDITIDTLPTLQGIYKDLKYIVGDNALCTGKIINSVKAKVMDVVSRNADHSSLSKECFEKGKGQKSQFEDIFPDDEQTPLGMWCDDCEIDGVKVKRLLVLNGALREKKNRTISRKAQNELERLTKGFEKLGANPCKCLGDAQKAVAELTKKVKFCTVDNISYEDVFKNTRGRPKKDVKKRGFSSCKSSCCSKYQ